MNKESNNISQSRRKGPIIWQSRLTACLLQVAFYVKARLCRSQIQNCVLICSFLNHKVNRFWPCPLQGHDRVNV